MANNFKNNKSSQGSHQPSRGQAPPKKRKPVQKARSYFSQLANGTMIIIGLVAFSVFLAIFILQSATDLFGLNKEEGLVTVTIPQDASIGKIAKILHKNGVITQPLTFRIYSSMKDKNDMYNAGEFQLETDWGYDQIMYRLCKSEIENAVVSITLREGMTAEEIGDSLEEKSVCTKAEFLEAMDTIDFGYKFEENIPESKNRYHKLEGYLFPDTYEFYVGEGAKSVVNRFLSNFNDKITGEMYSRMKVLDMNLDEVITLASIVQKEAAQYTTMKSVAGVFYNRMESGSELPMLQTDTTTNYIITTFIPNYKEGKPLESKTNQNFIDAYNTYSLKGLPIGPICNPGIDAIKAVLYSTESNDYFFVSDKAGKYYFSETIAQHEAAIAQVKQINEELKKQKAEE